MNQVFNLCSEYPIKSNAIVITPHNSVQAIFIMGSCQIYKLNYNCYVEYILYS